MKIFYNKLNDLSHPRIQLIVPTFPPDAFKTHFHIMYTFILLQHKLAQLHHTP